MVTYRSLKDVVYEYISNQITSGKLKPNESINEAAICSDLSISRTPVREALMQLSNEGYIEHIPRRGFFSRELNEQRVRNIFQIIGNLEAMAAGLALEHPEQLDLDGMRQTVDAMDQALAAHEYDRYDQLQHQFHLTFIQASGNEDLVQLVTNLKKVFMRQEYVFQASEYDIHSVFLKMNEEHRQIIKLFEAGDKATLRELIEDVHWNVKYATFHTFIR